MGASCSNCCYRFSFRRQRPVFDFYSTIYYETEWNAKTPSWLSFVDKEEADGNNVFLDERCFICLEDYNEQENFPRILPCGHIVCNQCLIELGRSSVFTTVKCPQDRHIFNVKRRYTPAEPRLPQRLERSALLLNASGPSVANASGASLSNVSGESLSNAAGPSVANASGLTLSNASGASVSNASGPSVANASGASLSNVSGGSLSNATGASLSNASGASVANACGASLSNVSGLFLPGDDHVTINPLYNMHSSPEIDITSNISKGTVSSISNNVSNSIDSTSIINVSSMNSSSNDSTSYFPWINQNFVLRKRLSDVSFYEPPPDYPTSEEDNE